MYNQMLINLKDAAFNYGLILNPKVIAVDIEQAAISALRLPSAKLIGCYFHFCHAIYNNIKKIGLKPSYSENESFKRWARMFMALPFIKMDDIDDIYDELTSDLPTMKNATDVEKLKEFLFYFKKKWIGTGPGKDN